MAITLNGTTGISSPGGDTSTSLATTNLSYTGTLTGGTGVIAIGTNQIYKDASGNVGLGVTPSAWYSTLKALQIGGTASVSHLNAGAGNQQANFGNNFYYNVSGVETYIQSTGAQRYRQLSGAGHVWENAPSGTAGNAIAFSQVMTLDASGNLSVAGGEISSTKGNCKNIGGMGYVLTTQNQVSTYTFNSSGVIVCVAHGGNGSAGIVFVDYLSSTVTILSNPSSILVASSSPNTAQIGIYKSAGSYTFSVKSGINATVNVGVSVIGGPVTATTGPV